MEGSLDAREFLSRFHLPQLVRIVSQVHRVEQKQRREDEAKEAKARRGARKRLTSLRDQTEKRCNWTYLEPEFVASGLKLRASDQAEQPECQSMSTWSMSLESAKPERRMSTKSQETSTPVRGRARLGSSMKLAPPSRRPTLSKLDLDQPFLLYKACRKVEVCAYVIDRRNELIERSGNPIFLPFSYPGKSQLDRTGSPRARMSLIVITERSVCLIESLRRPVKFSRAFEWLSRTDNSKRRARERQRERERQRSRVFPKTVCMWNRLDFICISTRDLIE